MATKRNTRRWRRRSAFTPPLFSRWLSSPPIRHLPWLIWSICTTPGSGRGRLLVDGLEHRAILHAAGSTCCGGSITPILGAGWHQTPLPSCWGGLGNPTATRSAFQVEHGHHLDFVLSSPTSPPPPPMWAMLGGAMTSGCTSTAFKKRAADALAAVWRLQPNLRLHSTNDPFLNGAPGATTRNSSLVEPYRHAAAPSIPYIYSMAWRDHTQGIPRAAYVPRNGGLAAGLRLS